MSACPLFDEAMQLTANPMTKTYSDIVALMAVTEVLNDSLTCAIAGTYNSISRPISERYFFAIIASVLHILSLSMDQ